MSTVTSPRAAFAALLLALAASFPLAADAQERATVETREAAELKSIYGVVQSRKVVTARARIGGSVEQLVIDEGAAVKSGQTIGVVTDEKLTLRIEALDAAIGAREAELASAEIAYDRAKELVGRRVASQSQLDDAETALQVAQRQLESARADRRVAARQLGEGAVLAPSSGRVLTVPVADGSVVQPGETIAQIATKDFVLRLSLPERHADALTPGGAVLVAERNGEGTQTREGSIVQVYPLLENGRVEADAEVEGLGDYFVGERAQVWLEIGKRQAIIAPRDFIHTRRGVDFARLAREDGEPIEVVVRLGPPLRDAPDQVEILSGLRAGDVLLKP